EDKHSCTLRRLSDPPDGGKICRYDEAECCAFTPSGNALVVGGDSAALKLFDAGTGETLATLSGHSGTVTSLQCWDDVTCVSSAYDKSARVWDLQAHKCTQIFLDHRAPVMYVGFLGQTTILSAARTRKVLDTLGTEMKVWDAKTGGCIFSDQIDG